MRFSLLPKLMADSVTQLTPEFLHRMDIRLLMLDFDNTIVPYTANEPTEEMSVWLDKMQVSDIKLCVVSNSKRDRVKIFCQARGIACITHSRKPFPKGISQCLRQFAVQPEHCALAGDQIYTDTLGANCAGVRSVLVKAIDNHNVWLKLRHILELPFIAMAYKRRIKL